MEAFRQYGQEDPQMVLIHGGPGAPGELRPLAQILEKKGFSVLEPFQRAGSISEQIEELYALLVSQELRKTILLGYSWGAWLSILFTEKYPDLVERLILVSTPPFTSEESTIIAKRRLEKLDPVATVQVGELTNQLESSDKEIRTSAFRDLGRLFHQCDSYSLVTDKEYVLSYDVDIYHAVWSEAEERRISGAMEKSLGSLTVPLIFIHGNDDSHPSSAILSILKRLDLDVVYYEIPNCGHAPWLERFGQFRFLSIIESVFRI